MSPSVKIQTACCIACRCLLTPILLELKQPICSELFLRIFQQRSAQSAVEAAWFYAVREIIITICYHAGCKQDLPDGYRGLILQAAEIQQPSSSQDHDAMDDDEHDQDGRARQQSGPSKSWTASAQFQSIHYWNHDNAPSRSDHMKRVFDWLSIAKTVSLECIMNLDVFWIVLTDPYATLNAFLMK